MGEVGCCVDDDEEGGSAGVYYASIMAIVALVTTVLSELSLGPWFTTAALTLKEVDVAERHLGSTDVRMGSVGI